MWRALFLAMGIYCCLLGVECLAIERAVLKRKPSKGPAVSAQREVVPPEWAPWSLMSGGIVVVIYSFTLPKRAQG